MLEWKVNINLAIFFLFYEPFLNPPIFWALFRFWSWALSLWWVEHIFMYFAFSPNRIHSYAYHRFFSRPSPELSLLANRINSYCKGHRSPMMSHCAKKTNNRDSPWRSCPSACKSTSVLSFHSYLSPVYFPASDNMCWTPLHNHHECSLG